MRGSNIKNIYVFDGKEYSKEELSLKHKTYIDFHRKIFIYNNLRNHLLYKYGDNYSCVIKFYYPEDKIHVYDDSNKLILIYYMTNLVS